jgi:hypothetical protein
MKRKRPSSPLATISLTCFILSVMIACTTADEDNYGFRVLSIRVNPSLAEIGAGQTVTVFAQLIDLRGKSYPADWSASCPSFKVRSVVPNPVNGTSSTSIAITADSGNFYFEGLLGDAYKPESSLVNVTASPTDKKLRPVSKDIRLTLKPTRVLATVQKTSLNQAQSVATGKCSFNIVNDSSNNTYSWELEGPMGAGLEDNHSTNVDNPTMPVIDRIIPQGRSVDITWTQDMTKVKLDVNYKITYWVRIKATSQDGHVMYCMCKPSCEIFSTMPAPGIIK